MVIDKEDKFLYSASRDASIKIWNLQNNQCVQHFKNAHEGNILPKSNSPVEDIFTLAITDDSSKLISGAHDGAIKIWNLKEKKVFQFENAHDGRLC